MSKLPSIMISNDYIIFFEELIQKLPCTNSNSMTGLQSFPPEICSLICRDPIIERLDLNSICFISHTFRNEAQRELSCCFPCLQGDRRVKDWCLSLKRRPHLAKNIRGLALLLPRPSAFRETDIFRLTRALRMCVNLKELSVLFQVCRRRRPGLHEYQYLSSTQTRILLSVRHRFNLTKFVNGYFSQDSSYFGDFLDSQPNLESLELHSGDMETYGVSPPRHLKSLGCSPKLLEERYSMKRLRLDFGNPNRDDRFWIGTYNELKILGGVLSRNLDKNMKSLAIFLKHEQSNFPEIIRVIAASHINIQHLEIHQFSPTQVCP